MNDVDMITGFVTKKILELNQDINWVKNILTKLRRGVGKTPGETPEIFEAALGGFPKALAGEGEPSQAENAVYTALTLYALSKLGKDDDSHKAGGDSFGRAVHKLVLNDKNRERTISTRFNAAITASDIAGFAHHAAGLVKMFKSGIPLIKLDYAQFAADLYRLFSQDTRNEVLYNWMSDFTKAG